MEKYSKWLIFGLEREDTVIFQDVYGLCYLPSGASHAIFDEHRKMWSNNVNVSHSPIKFINYYCI